MKKVFAICSMVVLSLFAVGCEKTIELTDEENQLIAEYAADLLLKYDKNLTSKYDADDKPFVSPHDYDTHTPTDPTEEPTTEATTEATTEDTITTEVPSTTETPSTTEQATTQSPAHGTGNMDDVSNDDIKVDYQYTDFDLAKYVDQENVSIKYQYAQITSTYPAYDNTGMYIEVQAPEGYKLLVLKFRIENLTNESQLIDLYDKDITYRIIVNNQKSCKQMFTILINDMYTYKASLGGSMIDDAVLLFQVSDGVANSIEDMKLKVEYNGKNSVIQLK